MNTELKPAPPASPLARLRPHRGEIAQVCAVLAVFWAVVLWLLFSGRVYLDADECTLAIMGWHIQRGELPLYFYGQNYMGCVESYLYALWDLVFRAPSVLTIKLFAALLSTVYLLSCYGIARRFTSRRMALFTLLLLAAPSQMMGIWLLKIRGYLPWLIVGNAIFYVLLSLLEFLDVQGRLRAAGKAVHASSMNIPAQRRLTVLGALLGLAWWINPLSIYYIVLTLIVIAFNPRLRRLFFAGGIRPVPGALAHWAVTAVAFALMSRSLFPSRHYPIMSALFEHRLLLVPVCLGAMAVFVAWGVARSRRDREDFPWHPGLFCVAFVGGSILQVAGTWRTDFLNLKQNTAPLQHFLEHMIQTPAFIFPNWFGLSQIEDLIDMQEGSGVFPFYIGAALIALYAIMAYAVLRHGVFEHRALRIIGLLVPVSLLMYNAQMAIETYEHRYLICAFFPLALGMGYLFDKLEWLRRGAGWSLAALLLAGNLYALGQLRVFPITRPDANLIPERELVEYLEQRELRYVYAIGRSQLAERISYFSRERVMSIQGDNVFCRQETYKQQFEQQQAFTIVMQEGLSMWREEAPQPDAIMDELWVYNRLSVDFIDEHAKMAPREAWPGDPGDNQYQTGQ